MTGIIDLNADVGESFGHWQLGDDAALLQVVSSANIACGFHAGDPTTMRRACALAAEHGVRVGAQVGYRDLVGFGRRFLDVAHNDLVDDVLAQIGTLEAFARIAGTRVAYVKPHGALYNAVVHHEQQAAAVVAAVREYDASLPLMGPPGSRSLTLAQGAGLAVLREAFADRSYTPTGDLVPRSEPGAVLVDPARIAARAVQLAVAGRVLAIDGTELALQVDTICLHGDTPGAVPIAQAVRAALAAAGVALPAMRPQP